MQAEILKSLFKVHTLWGERSRQSEVKNSMHNSEAISQVAEQSLCICIESSEVLIFWRISPTRKRFSTEVCSGEENPSSKEGVFDKFKLKKKTKQQVKNCQRWIAKVTLTINYDLISICYWLILTKQKLLIWVINSWPTRQSPLPSLQM